jgi:hypothetical protein
LPLKDILAKSKTFNIHLNLDNDDVNLKNFSTFLKNNIESSCFYNLYLTQNGEFLQDKVNGETVDTGGFSIQNFDSITIHKMYMALIEAIDQLDLEDDIKVIQVSLYK